jgi:surfactin synthase thioesterase subunit
MTDIPSANPSERARPWVLADRINQQIIDMRDFARILAMAGSSLGGSEGVAIDTVAFELVNRAERVHELVEELQEKLRTSADGNEPPAA